MLSDAMVLAILSTIGLLMLFKKLPRKIRKFLEKHAVFTDFLTFILTYLTLGSTLTALTAGCMVAIFTSMLIHIQAHPDDFMYLYDAHEAMKDGLAEVKSYLSQLGADYRDSKLSKKSNGVLHAVEVES